MRSSFIALLTATTLVSAHGILEQISINGKLYQGPTGGSENGIVPPPSVIRQVRNNGPVEGNGGAVNSRFMSCGNDAEPAPLEADAMPGDTVAFQWSKSWPHMVGPMITYMANCGGSCTSFDSSSAKWFKIDQKAYKPSSTEWVQKDIAAGQPDTVTIPRTLKAGSYLMRHEIIASHNIPVEYYPMCAQVKVGGGGNGVPTQDEVVSFPGGYTGQEGALNKGGYQPTEGAFQFPGPKLSALAEQGGQQNPPQPAPEAPAPVPSVPEGGSCSLNYKRNLVRRRAPLHAAKRASH